MGFRWRGRSKGKDSWTNWSISSRGLRSSRTMRFGRTTINIGPDGIRGSYNLGNGLRFVSRKKRKKAPTSKSKWSWNWLHNIQVEHEEKLKPVVYLTPEQEKRRDWYAKIFFRFCCIFLLYIGLALIASDHYYMAGLVFILIYVMW